MQSTNQLHREHRGPQSSRRLACSLVGSTRMRASRFERKTHLCYLRFLLSKKFENKIVCSPKTTRSLASLTDLCGPLCPLCNFLLFYPKGLNREWTQMNANKTIFSEKLASIGVHSRLKTKTFENISKKKSHAKPRRREEESQTKIVRSRETAQSLAGLPNLRAPLCSLCNFLLLYPKGLNREWTRIKPSPPKNSRLLASIRG